MFVLLRFYVIVSFNFFLMFTTVIMDMNGTAMASVCQHFGITHPPCQRTAALDRVISTALGKWLTRLYLARAPIWV